MGNTPDQYCQINSSSPPYFSKTLFLCVAVFVASLVLTCFVLFGISTFLLVTISILFLSTIFVVVTFSKKKVVVVTNNSGENESPICVYCYPQSQSVLGKEVVMEEQNPQVMEEPCQQSDVWDMHEYQALEPTDFPSDSDSGGDFSASDQSFELSWRFSENVGQSIALSESSISQVEEEEDDDDDADDADGLIEISLPQSNSVDHFNEESNKKSDSSNFLPESIFRQQCLMEEEEVFADQINEVNEEENLIEIDLSMGSIK